MSTSSARKMATRFPQVPLLENGDHMTQQEFHRRYEECPEDVKAELIGGIVFMASPLRRPHAAHHPELSGAFWLYKNATLGIELLDNATTILGRNSEPQPDLALRILSEWGGQSRVDLEQYIVGPPELAAEIAHSTRHLDLHLKRQEYQKAGVFEYVVLCIEEEELYWFDFKAQSQIRPNRQGIYHSRVFPGLWIDRAGLLHRDRKRVAEVVQMGLASREHAAFVKRLQTAHRKLSRDKS